MCLNKNKILGTFYLCCKPSQYKHRKDWVNSVVCIWPGANSVELNHFAIRATELPFDICQAIVIS